MGRIGLDIAGIAAGVAIGYFTGGTGFALVSAGMMGLSVGTMVGNALYPATTATFNTGPRLTDLTVTSSTYGAVIPWGTGTASVGGNLIWAAPIREQADVAHTSQGGKGGGGTATTTTTSYSYYGSFALAIGEGVVAKVLKIWADATLVYDITAPVAAPPPIDPDTGEPFIDPFSGAAASPVIAAPSFNFRFYPGDEEQMPDSIIEAALGTGMAPAFRGLSYLVFDDIPLVNYGNRIPQFTVEFTYGASPAPAADLVIMASPSILHPPASSELAGDWRLGFAWIASDNGLGRINVNTMIEDQQQPWANVTADGGALHALFVGPDSALYGGVGGASNYDPLARIDPYSMKETARFGVAWSGFGTPPPGGSFQYLSSLAGMTMYAPMSGKRDFLLAAGLFSDVGIITIPDMATMVWEGTIGSGLYERTAGCVGGLIGDGECEGWVLLSNVTGGLLELHKITLTATVEIDVGLTGGSAHEVLKGSTSATSFTPDQFDGDATAFAGWAGAVCYDRADNGVMFSVRVTTPSGIKTYACKWIEGLGLAWVTAYPASLASVDGPGPGYSASRPDGVAQTMLLGSTLFQIDAATGVLSLDQVSPYVAEGDSPGQLFDGTTSIIFSRVSGGNYAKIYVGRHAATPSSLADVVGDICTRAGMTDTQYDVSQLDADLVAGYLLNQVVSGSSAILPLAQAFMFNPAEIDNKLVFVKRGGAPKATISLNDFVRAPGTTAGQPEPYTETRASEIDLPSVISLTYMDPALDYVANTQQASRNRGPDPTVPSQNQTVIAMPVAMSGDQAIQSAQMQLYEAWVARHTFSLTLPPDYLWLTPTDPVMLALDVYSVRARIQTAAIGADFSQQVTLLAEGEGQKLVPGTLPVPTTAPQYVSVATAPVVALTPQRISISGPSELFILDVPLLRDIDSIGNLGLNIYWAGAPTSDILSGWPGVFLSVSATSDTTLWNDVGTDLARATWGVTETALADPASTCRTDTSGSVIVNVLVGAATIGGITDAALIAGHNSLAMLKGDGTVEILQFRDCVALGNARFRLSAFLRGRRGTDTMAFGHAAGERFVMLTSTAVQPEVLPLAALGGVRFWRSSTIGTLAATGDITSLTPRGRDQMPYAPVHIAAALAGSDIDLSWIRRTRLGGDLTDGTGIVPLNEGSEAYQVDILAAPGGAVLRTLTSAVSSVTYAAADIATDFGATPAALSLLVYQMSGTVGRGFARETLAEVS